MFDKIDRREFLLTTALLSLLVPFYWLFPRKLTALVKHIPFSMQFTNKNSILPGPPKASDVIMRSLRIHAQNRKDPHDTMQALRNFHANRLEWTYIEDINFIQKVKRFGRLFGGTVSATSYVPVDRNNDWFERVVIKDLNGKPIIAPWKRTWKCSLWGCMNNPELERGYVEYLKKYIDAGAQVMQRDEPGGNLLATRWGGCFCRYCMEGFCEYLKNNINSEALLNLGISDIGFFNYRQYLKGKGASVGDSFGKWDGGELKRLFLKYQVESTEAFHKRTRQAINEYAGCEIPMTCNNGATNRGAIEQVFDWWLGELSYEHARPDYLYRIMNKARKYGKHQVVTMPKKGNYDKIEEWVLLTRQTIAMAYACGGQCMVPWDIFMPNNVPRYFGSPCQYADLYGFVRANERFFDSYQEMEAIGPKITKKSRKTSRLSVIGNSAVCVVIRRIPESPEKPIVGHLVDWSNKAKPFKLELDPDLNIKKSARIQLLIPTPYVQQEHDTAEIQGDYEKLSKSIDLGLQNDNSLSIPALEPWGLIVIHNER